jgi:[ribosomal protein S5]-alanine N-acetyltransferase
MNTKRLQIRLYQESDHDDLIKLFTDKDVMKFVDTGVFSNEKAESLWKKLFENFYAKGLKTIYGVFAIEDNRYIGHTAIRPRPTKTDEWEISYILKKDEWKKGFATEIAKKLVQFGFDELKLNAVFATVDTDNFASIHILEKIGMKKVKDEYDERGLYYVYGIKKS